MAHRNRSLHPPPKAAGRIALLQPFLAMEVMERAFALEREGADVIHLEIGEPDFDPPPAAVAACAEALAAGETRYTDSRGLAPLREAIAADRERRFGVSVSPDQVLVTQGTSPGLLLVFSLLVEAGDQVILGTPHYPCYPNFIRYCGGEPVFVPTRPEDGYRLDPDAVAAARTDRTRAIVVGSPANPTGSIQSRETLAALAELGLPLVSDEIYDGLVYDGARVTSAAQVADGAFVLDGFSKRYAMTGFRLGYVVAPPDAVRALQILQQNLFISANRFVQHAGLAALERGEDTRRAMCEAYARRRDRLVAGLRELGFGVPAPPPGAFYVLADATRFDADSRRLASRLLEGAHVGTTPGIDFGPAAEGHLRFCYAVDDDRIEAALERLRPALAECAR
ncbi:MAG: pyridoxal phosphate-dependent aminotransferase [Proteobacteria bacterium]|nr:pyridoxal phosphate-dependent aminotransferase [Pseudomonadota bacterium]